MPDLRQFRLPDVGEGLTEADILAWSVAPGDHVVVNQTLVEVETAKAAVELPSPFAGVVSALHAAEGETVEVGRPIITIDTAPLDQTPAQVRPAPAHVRPAPAQVRPAPAHVRSAPADPPPADRATDPVPPPPGESTEGAPREAVLVGYGPRSGPPRRRVRRVPRGQDHAATPTAQAAFAVDPTPPRRPPVGGSRAGEPTAGEPTAGESAAGESAAAQPLPVVVTVPDNPVRALATPPVRKLAKSLGLDLDGIRPTGPNGSVSRADVERAVAEPNPAFTEPTAQELRTPGSTPSDRGWFGEGLLSVGAGAGGREERIPIRGVRKHMAAAMVASAFTAPHVTEFVTVDVTAMMELRDRLAARREFADVKLSPLALVARATMWAIARTPIVNSTWDDAAGEIVVKRYVNLGVAAATGRGLVVPNIKDAQALSLRELADALRRLTETARAGRTSPGDLAGGTFTITNVGVFGVDTGTPILNPGEAAILALGAVRRAPWVVRRGDDEIIEARWVTQLALSFDHRVVDGEQGSVFLTDVAAVLTDPGLALG